MKVAVTDWAAFTVTAQASEPVQAPFQPVKDERRGRGGRQGDVGAVVVVLGASVPQSMPAGDDVTVPVPLPSRLVVSACCSGAAGS